MIRVMQRTTNPSITYTKLVACLWRGHASRSGKLLYQLNLRPTDMR